MKSVVLASMALLPLSAISQTCMPRTDEQLAAMSVSELKVAYCAARAAGIPKKEEAAVLQKDEQGQLVVAPRPNPCLAETSQLVRTLEELKVDVDKAIEECGKPAP